LNYRGRRIPGYVYKPGGREFDEARAARRRASPQSSDDPERSEGRAGEAREQSRRARRLLLRDRRAFDLQIGAGASPEHARRWIAGTPHPAPMNRERRPGDERGHDSRGDSDDNMREEGERPD